jgi:3-methyladenine DNA glycosylase AlkD
VPKPSPSVKALKAALAKIATPERAKSSAWFFKTGEGEYGEGDTFIGVSVPDLRRVALQHREIEIDAVADLLASAIHEHRLAALEILVAKFEEGDAKERKQIFDFYLRHTAGINNWDLVDASAPYIVGAHLRTRSRRVLDRLAKSKSIWERRIAIVATFGFLNQGEVDATLRIAETLLDDKHALIHKAVGWALRESGKVSEEALVGFLREHYSRLPRTTLRYAIERFPPERRVRMLRGDFD